MGGRGDKTKTERSEGNPENAPPEPIENPLHHDAYNPPQDKKDASTDPSNTGSTVEQQVAATSAERKRQDALSLHSPQAAASEMKLGQAKTLAQGAVNVFPKDTPGEASSPPGPKLGQAKTLAQSAVNVFPKDTPGEASSPPGPSEDRTNQGKPTETPEAAFTSSREHTAARIDLARDVRSELDKKTANESNALLNPPPQAGGERPAAEPKPQPDSGSRPSPEASKASLPEFPDNIYPESNRQAKHVDLMRLEQESRAPIPPLRGPGEPGPTGSRDNPAGFLFSENPTDRGQQPARTQGAPAAESGQPRGEGEKTPGRSSTTAPGETAARGTSGQPENSATKAAIESQQASFPRDGAASSEPGVREAARPTEESYRPLPDRSGEALNKSVEALKDVLRNADGAKSPDIKAESGFGAKTVQTLAQSGVSEGTIAGSKAVQGVPGVSLLGDAAGSAIDRIKSDAARTVSELARAAEQGRSADNKLASIDGLAQREVSGKLLDTRVSANHPDNLKALQNQGRLETTDKLGTTPAGRMEVSGRLADSPGAQSATIGGAGGSAGAGKIDGAAGATDKGVRGADGKIGRSPDVPVVMPPGMPGSDFGIKLGQRPSESGSAGGGKIDGAAGATDKGVRGADGKTSRSPDVPVVLPPGMPGSDFGVKLGQRPPGSGSGDTVKGTRGDTTAIRPGDQGGSGGGRPPGRDQSDLIGKGTKDSGAAAGKEPKGPDGKIGRSPDVPVVLPPGLPGSDFGIKLGQRPPGKDSGEGEKGGKGGKPETSPGQPADRIAGNRIPDKGIGTTPDKGVKDASEKGIKNGIKETGGNKPLDNKGGRSPDVPVVLPPGWPGFPFGDKGTKPLDSGGDKTTGSRVPGRDADAGTKGQPDGKAGRTPDNMPPVIPGIGRVPVGPSDFSGGARNAQERAPGKDASDARTAVPGNRPAGSELPQAGTRARGDSTAPTRPGQDNVLPRQPGTASVPEAKGISLTQGAARSAPESTLPKAQGVQVPHEARVGSAKPVLPDLSISGALNSPVRSERPAASKDSPPRDRAVEKLSPGTAPVRGSEALSRPLVIPLSDIRGLANRPGAGTATLVEILKAADKHQSPGPTNTPLTVRDLAIRALNTRTLQEKTALTSNPVEYKVFRQVSPGQIADSKAPKKPLTALDPALATFVQPVSPYRVPLEHDQSEYEEQAIEPILPERDVLEFENIESRGSGESKLLGYEYSQLERQDEKKEPEQRRKYVVQPGDTLETIAATVLDDSTLALLLFEINKDHIPTKIADNERVLDLRPGTILYLPNRTEVKEFRIKLAMGMASMFKYAPQNTSSTQAGNLRPHDRSDDISSPAARDTAGEDTSPPILVYSPTYNIDLSEYGVDKPFALDRGQMVLNHLQKEAELPMYAEPQPIAMEDLLLVHTPAYIDSLKDPQVWLDILELKPNEFNPDQAGRPLNELLEDIRLKCGGTLLAVEIALKRGLSANLGGGYHHAFPDQGRGFCVLHDIAVAIRSAIKRGLCRKVMIVDVDFHQGDGSALIFQNDQDVYTLSIHSQEGWPDEKQVSDLDVPIACDEDFLYQLKLEQAVNYALQSFTPDLVLYVAGSDPYMLDVLPGTKFLQLSLTEMRERDQFVIDTFADKGIPLAMVYAGGYGPDVWEVHYWATRRLLERAGKLLTAVSGS